MSSRPPSDQDFREEAREWLQAHVPREPRPNDGAAMRDFDIAWQRAQYDGGWAGISWPREHGGRGCSLIQQMIWHEEYARAGAPYSGVNFVGISHAGPTLIMRGTEVQKRAHLEPILRGDAIWCQGFSEPNAGSDLASLQTRGEIDGDHLVVNGRKIWTSFADHAHLQELLVRTDRQAARHKGISWVICDMRTPGITVRPIQTIYEGFHFCEVTYDDVRIPLANVVGDLNDGWNVAQCTLSFERGTAFIALQMELAERLDRLVELARNLPASDGRRQAIEDDEVARGLGMLRAEVAGLRSLAYASIARTERRGTPGPEGSILKLYYGELFQKLERFAMELRGPAALSMDPVRPDWTRDYLYSFKDTISAGAAQIQRNIIGERILGLPRERR